MVIITKVATGWLVKVETPEGSASTTVSFEQWEELGKDAFNQAEEFLISTIEEGY